MSNLMADDGTRFKTDAELKSPALKDLLCTKWKLHRRSKKLWQTNFVVMTDDGRVVVECLDEYDIAMHIIKMHNKYLSA